MLNHATTRRLRRIMPGKEPITFRSRNYAANSTPFTDYLLAQAKQFKGVTTHEGPDNSVPVTRCTWLLWAELIEAAQAPAPKNGDMIVQADGTAWIVKSRDVKMFDNDYGLECIQKVGT